MSTYDEAVADILGSSPERPTDSTGTPAPSQAQPAAPQRAGTIDYSAAVADMLGQSARAGFVVSQQQDPDAYARAQDLARRTGVPVPTAQTQGAIIEPAARTGEIDFPKLARETPATAGLLTDPVRAPMVHDDLDNLSAWERTVRGIAGDVGVHPLAPGATPGIARAVRGLFAGPFDFGAAAYGVGETAAKWGAEAISPIVGTLLPENPLARMGAWFEARRKAGQAVTQEVAGDQSGAGIVERGVVGGFRSLSANAPGLAVSLATGSPVPALLAGGGMAGAQASTKALDAGLSAGQAATYGIEDAAAEVALGALPIGRLLHDVRAGSGFARLLAGQLATEIPTEAATTAVQGFNEWANLHPERTIGDYLQAQGPAQAETAISALVQTVLTAGLSRGFSRAAAAQVIGEDRRQSAEQTAALVGKLNELAKASKVLTRDPGTFERFIETAAEGGPVQDVYLSAAALHQEGLTDQLAALSPTVARQLADLGASGNIRIPVQEYAARVAGTDLGPKLADHLRTDPDGFSRAEARDWIANEGDAVREEFERAVAEDTADRTHREQVAEVQATIKAELDALGRFQPAVNDLYSLLVGQWYGATAARLGMTPEALFERYRLRVGMVAGADALHQFAGQRALTADRLALATAQERLSAGDDPEAVRQASAPRPENAGQPSSNPERFALHQRGANETTTPARETQAAAPATAGRTAEVTPAEAGTTPTLGDTTTEGNTHGEGQTGRRQEVLTARGDSSPRLTQDTGAIRGAFDPESLTIALTDKADLSTFLHESGHFFLETSLSLADEIAREAEGLGGQLFPGEREFVSDMNAVLRWFGLTDRAEWHAADPEQRRSYHEQFARGFEAYLWDGKAPSIELGRAFQTFRAWMSQVYRGLVRRMFPDRQSLTPAETGEVLRVQLTPEVRAVFDRMIATTDQIQAAERGRSMFPLFTSPEQARTLGVTIDDWDAYQRQSLAATQAAIEELQARGLKDLAWLDRARGRELGRLKREAADRRAEVNMEARGEVLSQPVYRAWDFLTRKASTEDMSPEQVAETRHREALKAWRAVRDAAEPRVRLDAQQAAWEASEEGRVRYRKEATQKRARARVLKREAAQIDQDTAARMQAWEAENPAPARPGADRPRTDPKTLDPERDSLFQAVGKLGGLDKAAVISTWGWDPADKPTSRVVGRPFWRETGGLSLDAMSERLAAAGYLPVDEHGKTNPADFEDLMGRELRGEVQYSNLFTPPEPAAGLWVTNPLGLSAGRLDRAALADMMNGPAGLPREVVDALDKRRMVRNGGLSPDLVAGLFGYDSGHALALALAEAVPPREAVTARADALMMERYADLATPEALALAADAAVHNEARGRFIASEANALARASGGARILADAARDLASGMIGRQRVRDIRPSQYANGQSRAARAAEKASRAGDTATAAAEKRNEVLQHYLARAASQALSDVDRGVRYLRRLTRNGGADLRARVGADYGDQIESLLERFDLHRITGRESERRASFAAWLAAQREAGLEPEVPAYLEQDASRQNYRDLTADDFRALVDTVRQVEHLGRLKRRLLTAAKDREYRAIRDELVSSIEAHAGTQQADTRTPTTRAGEWLAAVRRFGAAHIKVATWARIMDGGQDGGPVWEYLVRPANARADWETTRTAQATRELAAIMAPVLKQGSMGGAGQFFQSINRSLNRQARLAIALNTGNASNMQRLLGGEGWAQAQVRPVLESLTAAEWQAVQAIWDHFESYRPEISAKERRVYGREPKWIDPVPFQIRTADGQTVDMRGGYYPVRYDPAASARAESQADADAAAAQLRGAYTSATTRRSYTKGRVEEVQGRPLLYTLSGLYSGVTEVIHDLAWHEWLIDANRLLRSQSIDQAIRGHYGPEVKAQFKTWVQDIAEGQRGAQSALDSALGRLRHGISAAGLGFNVMSALMQPLGITQSVVRVGAPWISRGVAGYIAHPIERTREAVAASPFMAERFRTQFRELNELRNQIQGRNAFSEFAGRYGYWLMMRVQQMVDVPTWHGARAKAIADGADEARAVALADQAVIDSQGSGMSKDLSAIERGGPAQKLFTVFYSYMNTALNLGYGQTKTADTPARRGRLAADYLLLYVAPVVLAAALKDALTPGDSGNWDDPEKVAHRLGADLLGFLFGLGVVVREFGDLGKTLIGTDDPVRAYSGPAGTRVIADVGAMAVQAHQGEFDAAFQRAAINLFGDLFGLPAAQINRTIKGVKALNEGQTSNPAALLLGFQEQ